MYGSRMVEQVRRKPKKMTKLLKAAMIFFGVLFVLMGIMISQAFMLAGSLLVLLYFVYDVYSQKEYEYTLEENMLSIDVIMGRRYRKNVHVLNMQELEVVAPSGHESVAKYRKNGGSVRLPKYDYTSYDDAVPYYTMIVMEDKTKIKVLLDLDEEFLRALKRLCPTKVFA